MSKEPWYAVRLLFQFPGEDPPSTYEERITLWRAASIDEAIERAETEATEYTAGGDGTYIGLAQAFHLFADAEMGDGTEVFSLMRDSTLGPTDYINQFFDTGAERPAGAGDGAGA